MDILTGFRLALRFGGRFGFSEHVVLGLSSKRGDRPSLGKANTYSLKRVPDVGLILRLGWIRLLRLSLLLFFVLFRSSG